MEPRADHTFTGLDTPRRQAAASAGAVLAVSSLAGAAIMLSSSTPGATSAGALDEGYPGKGALSDPLLQGGDAVTEGGLPIPLARVAFPGPLGPGGLPTSALSRGVV
ncbi:MAG: hypothetical protein M3Z25_18890, partial [Actinomycetota bacterium]|nr:hypothetical protein [Actinomycetota bacterium]